MSLEIAIPNDTPCWTQETTLDGERFVLRFRWNDIAGAWFMSVFDVEEQAIVLGRKLVADWPVMHRVTDPRRPKGEFFVMDMLGEGAPRYADLGRRVRLVYVTAAELGRG